MTDELALRRRSLPTQIILLSYEVFLFAYLGTAPKGISPEILNSIRRNIYKYEITSNFLPRLREQDCKILLRDRSCYILLLNKSYYNEYHYSFQLNYLLNMLPLRISERFFYNIWWSVSIFLPTVVQNQAKLPMKP